MAEITDELTKAAERIDAHYGDSEMKFDDLSGPHRSAQLLARHYLAANKPTEDLAQLRIDGERWRKVVEASKDATRGPMVIDANGDEVCGDSLNGFVDALA